MDVDHIDAHAQCVRQFTDVHGHLVIVFALFRWMPSKPLRLRRKAFRLFAKGVLWTDPRKRLIARFCGSVFLHC